MSSRYKKKKKKSMISSLGDVLSFVLTSHCNCEWGEEQHRLRAPPHYAAPNLCARWRALPVLISNFFFLAHYVVRWRSIRSRNKVRATKKAKECAASPKASWTSW